MLGNWETKDVQERPRSPKIPLKITSPRGGEDKKTFKIFHDRAGTAEFHPNRRPSSCSHVVVDTNWEDDLVRTIEAKASIERIAFSPKSELVDLIAKLSSTNTPCDHRSNYSERDYLNTVIKSLRKEMLTFQQAYVKGLKIILEQYARPLRWSEKAVCPSEHLGAIFGNIELIVTAERKLLDTLETIPQDASDTALADMEFMKSIVQYWGSDMQYKEYIGGYETSQRALASAIVGTPFTSGSTGSGSGSGAGASATNGGGESDDKLQSAAGKGSGRANPAADSRPADRTPFALFLDKRHDTLSNTRGLPVPSEVTLALHHLLALPLAHVMRSAIFIACLLKLTRRLKDIAVCDDRPAATASGSGTGTVDGCGGLEGLGAGAGAGDSDSDMGTGADVSAEGWGQVYGEGVTCMQRLRPLASLAGLMRGNPENIHRVLMFDNMAVGKSDVFFRRHHVSGVGGMGRVYLCEGELRILRERTSSFDALAGMVGMTIQPTSNVYYCYLFTDLFAYGILHDNSYEVHAAFDLRACSIHNVMQCGFTISPPNGPKISFLAENNAEFDVWRKAFALTAKPEDITLMQDIRLEPAPKYVFEDDADPELKACVELERSDLGQYTAADRVHSRRMLVQSFKEAGLGMVLQALWDTSELKRADAVVALRHIVRTHPGGVSLALREGALFGLTFVAIVDDPAPPHPAPPPEQQQLQQQSHTCDDMPAAVTNTTAAQRLALSLLLVLMQPNSAWNYLANDVGVMSLLCSIPSLETWMALAVLESVLDKSPLHGLSGVNKVDSDKQKRYAEEKRRLTLSFIRMNGFALLVQVLSIISTPNGCTPRGIPTATARTLSRLLAKVARCCEEDDLQSNLLQTIGSAVTGIPDPATQYWLIHIFDTFSMTSGAHLDWRECIDDRDIIFIRNIFDAAARSPKLSSTCQDRFPHLYRLLSIDPNSVHL